MFLCIETFDTISHSIILCIVWGTYNCHGVERDRCHQVPGILFVKCGLRNGVPGTFVSYILVYDIIWYLVRSFVFFVDAPESRKDFELFRLWCFCASWNATATDCLIVSAAVQSFFYFCCFVSGGVRCFKDVSQKDLAETGGRDRVRRHSERFTCCAGWLDKKTS